MKLNMGTADRIIRLMIASVLAALFFWNVVSGNLAILLITAASIFTLSSVAGLCQMYFAIGVNTCMAEDRE